MQNPREPESRGKQHECNGKQHKAYFHNTAEKRIFVKTIYLCGKQRNFPFL